MQHGNTLLVKCFEHIVIHAHMEPMHTDGAILNMEAEGNHCIPKHSRHYIYTVFPQADRIEGKDSKM